MLLELIDNFHCQAIYYSHLSDWTLPQSWLVNDLLSHAEMVRIINVDIHELHHIPAVLEESVDKYYMLTNFSVTQGSWVLWVPFLDHMEYQLHKIVPFSGTHADCTAEVMVDKS